MLMPWHASTLARRRHPGQVIRNPPWIQKKKSELHVCRGERWRLIASALTSIRVTGAEEARGWMY